MLVDLQYNQLEISEKNVYILLFHNQHLYSFDQERQLMQVQRPHKFDLTLQRNLTQPLMCFGFIPNLHHGCKRSLAVGLLCIKLSTLRSSKIFSMFSFASLNHSSSAL